MTDQSNEYREQAQPEGEFVEEFQAKADEPSLAPGEKFTPEQLGEAMIKFATETAYAAAGLANVLAERARVFYDAQRKEIAAKTPEGVDPNFRQFVDGMPDQFKGFFDEATKAFHEMAERGRVTVTDFQKQVQVARDAARDAKTNQADPFDLEDDAAPTAEAADAVAPEDAQNPVGDPVTDAYPGESKGEIREG